MNEELKRKIHDGHLVEQIESLFKFGSEDVEIIGSILQIFDREFEPMQEALRDILEDVQEALRTRDPASLHQIEAWCLAALRVPDGLPTSADLDADAQERRIAEETK
jgi:hypothetical protein